MGTFLHCFASSYIAATLLLSGAGHILRFKSFRIDLRAHQVIARRLSGLLALAITSLESVLGIAAAISIGGGGAYVFVASLLLGGGFLTYLVHLLMKPVPPVSCGCSILESPLTPASILPSLGLILTALTGLVAGSMSSAKFLAAESTALGIAWGTTLAGLTLLLPATMPEMHKVRN